MPAVARCLLLALNFLLLSSPGFLEPLLGGSRAFLLATILITIVNVALALYWDRMAPPADTTALALEKAPAATAGVWYRARHRFFGALVLLAAAALLPFLPFAIWDGPALKYALYGSYQNVMKGFVWMALALFAFSMTTLWPVIYLYFDVCLLLVCAGLSEIAWVRTRSLAMMWTTVLAASLLIVAIVAWFAVPVNAAIDAGTAADRAYLYSGFSSDEREGDVTFA